MTTPSCNNDDQFSFGVIADVQWADSDDGYNYAKTVKRCYRGALKTLQSAVGWWCDMPQSPLFIAQLGDLIDGMNKKLGQSESAIEIALESLNKAPCPSVNIVGNHELYNFNRKELAAASWTKHGDREYYSFIPVKGWRVVVLDPYQIALIGHAKDDRRRQEAVEILARENSNVDPNAETGDWFEGMDKDSYQRRFVPYNGGFGEEQLLWFQSELSAAAKAEERVMILSHIIIHPKACSGSTMAWDYEAALNIIRSEDSCGCVVAVLSGHDHAGGYHCDDDGVHHCTFISPLNKGDEGSAFGMVHMKSNSMEIRSPKIEDLLPNVSGRPNVHTLSDWLSGPCESITMPLRTKTNHSTRCQQGETESEESLSYENIMSSATTAIPVKVATGS